jgi:hypothetical protein
MSQAFRLKMPIVLLIILLIAANLGCDPQKKSGTNSIVKPGTSINKFEKPASLSTDTLLINSNSAVFFKPDSLQLQTITSLLSEQESESLIHESFYQMRNARNVVKKHFPKIDIIEDDKAKYLLFVKKNDSATLINLDEVKDIYGIFLFQRTKDPELADMMNIETALHFYFQD